MEIFVTCQKRMRAVDGKQEIYLEWPYVKSSHVYNPFNNWAFITCAVKCPHD